MDVKKLLRALAALIFYGFTLGIALVLLLWGIHGS
jgi:hypothetical protein